MGGGATGWAAGTSEKLGPAFFPEPMFGQAQRDAVGGGEDSRGEVDEFASDGRGDCFAEGRAGEGFAGAGEVERDEGQHKQGRMAVKTPDGKCARADAFVSGVQVFYDGMLAVGLVGVDGVQGAGGEESTEAEQVKESALASSNGFVQPHDAPGDEVSGDLFAFLLGAEGGETSVGYLSVGDPLPGRVVEDRVGVFHGHPRGVGDRAGGRLHPRIQAGCDRHLRTRAEAASPSRSDCGGSGADDGE